MCACTRGASCLFLISKLRMAMVRVVFHEIKEVAMGKFCSFMRMCRFYVFSSHLDLPSARSSGKATDLDWLN